MTSFSRKGFSTDFKQLSEVLEGQGASWLRADSADLAVVLSHTVMVAGQGAATATVTTYSRTTVPHPNSRTRLSLELPLLP